MAQFSKGLRRERRRCYTVIATGFEILIQVLVLLSRGNYLGAFVCLAVAVVQLVILTSWVAEITDKMKAEKRNVFGPPGD